MAYIIAMDIVINELKDFINTAERDRKYASNTATGYRVALGLFEKELNEKERESLQTLKENLDAIYQNVYRSNKTKFKSKSLEDYKNRVRKVIRDFEAFGNDPSKMASWNPSKPKSTGTSKAKIDNQSELPQLNKTEELPVALTRFELPLRSNVKAIILTPSDLTVEEADKIRAYIDYLKSVSVKGDK